MKDNSLFIQFSKEGKVSSKLSTIIRDFYSSYKQATHQGGKTTEESDLLFNQLIELINQQIHHPYKFNIFNSSIRKPFDYYQFGLDFIRPLLNFEKSDVLRLELVDRMIQQLARGENVILLANHQTEPDPQIISLLLQKRYPDFAANMIFVAGHRVIEDPMAIPLSMGCNLLCIYSKKHIDTPPEDKPKKVSHNQRTMKKMSELLSEGGKCIYVAPSGGRDRPDAKGKFTVAPFDPQSIEMFWLMAQKSAKTTHFYPLTLLTHQVLPPPKTVEKELGEKRIANHAPAYLAFGNEFDMENFTQETMDRKEKRNQRALLLWQCVQKDYAKLLELNTQRTESWKK